VRSFPSTLPKPGSAPSRTTKERNRKCLNPLCPRRGAKQIRQTRPSPKRCGQTSSRPSTSGGRGGRPSPPRSQHPPTPNGKRSGPRERAKTAGPKSPHARHSYARTTGHEIDPRGAGHQKGPKTGAAKAQRGVMETEGRSATRAHPLPLCSARSRLPLSRGIALSLFLCLCGLFVFDLLRYNKDATQN